MPGPNALQRLANPSERRTKISQTHGTILSKDLVKRPRVRETAIPHLVDRPDSVEIALALRATPHRLHRPPAHTILVVICEFEYLVAEELV
jgi:hypothetical protein